MPAKPSARAVKPASHPRSDSALGQGVSPSSATPKPLIPPCEGDANICRHLKQAAAQYPHQLAVAVQRSHRRALSQRELRYSELDFVSLDRRSDALAFALNAHGITRGMKAVLMVTPSLEFFALTFALFKAGVIPILVDP
ncbi:MAG: AMP-binding protein, partial [Shewanella sp.]